MKEEDLFTACWAAINGSFSFWGTDAAKWGWGTGCNLDVGRCADLVPVCFGVDCGTLCRSGFCMLRCWMRGAVPIYFFGDTAGCFIGYGLF